ncbi:MAG: hypothetical protein QT00_C0001G0424 [archaeon GW2011_AR5]|nr:MAG: hypothetical protein QT00_C0001G0424 [archaeon GW2011_AR5]
MGFDHLSEVVFCSGCRFRASDSAPMINYRLVMNYRDTLEREPEREEALRLIRKK